MKKTRFSESQIVAILKEVELGAKVGETSRKHSVSEPTYYKWKSQFSGMTVPRRLPCQVDSSKLETSCLNTLGLNAAGGTSPRDSWGRYSL